ncbi:MBL fold metallo-hydrolase [Nannocystis pusilla]|uniref:MBL fold metallo-hydrolase n=1 Tax=Nannocystis pusilla TaxID=889268 RepID=UPI003B7C1F9D
MNRRTRARWLVLALAVGVPLAALVNSFRAAPLPAPPELVGELPRASPPAEMALVHLPTGLTRRSAGFAYRGGAFSDRREFTMSAALVRHPRGDVLIDTGFGRDIDAHFGQMPLYFRATTRYEAATPAAEQLDAAGYARERLRGILLTHAHWDHVSGVPDFPGRRCSSRRRSGRSSRRGSLTAVARGSRRSGTRNIASTAGPTSASPRATICTATARSWWCRPSGTRPGR